MVAGFCRRADMFSNYCTDDLFSGVSVSLELMQPILRVLARMAGLLLLITTWPSAKNVMHFCVWIASYVTFLCALFHGLENLPVSLLGTVIVYTDRMLFQGRRPHRGRH